MDQIIARCPGYGCNFVCYNDEDLKNLRIHFGKTKHNLHPFILARNNSKNVKSVFSLKEYVQRKDREPVIGLEYILEYKLQLTPNDKTETKYFCEICEFDSELTPMLDHLSDFKHQKLYLAKVYPYVLKAPSSRTEDRTQFMKRMAKEIEKEVGTKMHKTDPVIRTVPMINKQSKRKTRWDTEDLQKRMKKALDYLESFEIDNACEAATVTRLIDKLTAELKFYSDKLKDEALFPAKVARAKDVASLLMQNTSNARLAPKNPHQKPQKSKKGFIKPPPSLTKPPPPKNISSKKNVNIPRGSLQTSTKKTHLTSTPAAAPTYAGAPNAAAAPMHAGAPNAAAAPMHAGAPNFAAPPMYPGAPNAAAPPMYAGAPNAAAPLMYAGAPNAAAPLMYAGVSNAAAPPMYAGAPNAAAPPMYAAAQSAYPQNPQAFQTANPNLGPQIDQTVNEDLKFVKKLKALLGVLSQNSDNSQNAQNSVQPDNSRNAKLQLLKSLLLNKTAKPGITPGNQLGMQMASLTQDMANSENVSLNQQLTILATRNNATMAQFSQNILMNMGPTAQNAYPIGNSMNMASLLGNSQVNVNPFVPGNQYAPNHGYVQMDNNALMLMNQASFQHPHMGQQPGFTSTAQGNENFAYAGLMADNYGNSHVSGYGDIPRQGENASYSSISNTGKNQGYDDYRAEQLPFAQDSENTSYDTDLRESVSPAPANKLTVDLLKRIKGKDPFMVSAILSEYAEHSS